jgi:hypothetical protein
MSAPRRFRPTAEFFRRLLAGGSAVLVFALSLFAASPALHDWLHHGSDATDDGCAVVLFASGVSLPLDTPVVAPPVAIAQVESRQVAREIFVASPRYLRQPERGPPALG